MGNCQAAEAAAAVVQHSSGKVDRLYWSASAGEVMSMYPGHYVAVILAAPLPAPRRPASLSSSSSVEATSRRAQRHLKLLRPDDTLRMGHVYRLVSFEEVLKEISTKKHVKLSRLVMSWRHREKEDRRGVDGGASSSPGSRTSTTTEEVAEEARREEAEEEVVTEEEEDEGLADGGGGAGLRVGMGMGRRHAQWRPVLQTIAEVGN